MFAMWDAFLNQIPVPAQISVTTKTIMPCPCGFQSVEQNSPSHIIYETGPGITAQLQRFVGVVKTKCNLLLS